LFLNTALEDVEQLPQYLPSTGLHMKTLYIQQIEVHAQHGIHNKYQMKSFVTDIKILSHKSSIKKTTT